MTVECHRLGAGQGGIAGVEVRPARLHQAQLRALPKVRHGLEQKVGVRAKIGVEDGDVLAARLSHSPGQRPGLEAAAVWPPQHDDVGSTLAVERRPGLCQLACLVGRIVQNLDVQPVAGIIERSHGIDDSLDHVTLVIHGYLHGDGWQIDSPPL